ATASLRTIRRRSSTMSQTPDRPQEAHRNVEETREELNRVLASQEFRTSKRCQDFLQYVVENTLQGHGDMLKERTIGIEDFGMPTRYDPRDDATVGVKAGEFRKRLGMYYPGRGAQDAIRIELPSGTYVPEFHAGHAPPAEALIPAEAVPPVPEKRPPRLR